MDRRLFAKQLSVLSLASCASPYMPHNAHSLKSSRLSSDQPLAIAMWDFSWLLRRYPRGGFEEWEKALDDLIVRGYNALRIDCFPQFIAKNDAGDRADIYTLPKRGNHRVLWGNEKTVEIQPLPELMKFLKLCKERNLAIVLSSWFQGHGTNRNKSFSGVQGLVRAWDETLQHIEDNSLLDDIVYVDLLNEYPLWHGYTWLSDELQHIKNVDQVPFDFLNDRQEKRYNPEQITFYNQFINNVIRILKKKWPKIKFTVSLTNTLNTPWQDFDANSCEVLDIHQWMIYNKDFSKQSKYFDTIHTYKPKTNFAVAQKAMMDYWMSHKKEMTDWLKNSMKERKTLADSLAIPLGCTEGWGSVMWMEHKDLNWDFVKQSGLLAAHLGNEIGYSFNCSSNFTHPHFSTLWEDVDWHQEVTKVIRKL